MNKTITFEIPQSEWEKFNTELTRIVAVMQEQQRESEERQERITDIRAEREKIRRETKIARENAEKYLVGV